MLNRTKSTAVNSAEAHLMADSKNPALDGRARHMAGPIEIVDYFVVTKNTSEISSKATIKNSLSQNAPIWVKIDLCNLMSFCECETM